MTLHVYQDLATPHNTDLLNEMRGRVNVVCWYGHKRMAHLPWTECVDVHSSVRHLSEWRGRLSFLYALMFVPFRRRDEFLIVGHSSVWSRLAILVHLIVGRNFGYWTDHPQDHGRRRVARQIAHWILKARAQPVFAVGEECMRYFDAAGFDASKLVNLPVSVAIPATDVASARRKWREQLAVPVGRLMVVAASRLVHAKGYDVLIDAVASLPKSAQENALIVIVGEGPEYQALQTQIDERGVGHIVKLDQFRTPEEYLELIAAADFFVHPARFDAFGGGTLYAMALGVPVIGSTGAGAARERIVHHESGWLCQPGDVAGLAAALAIFLENDRLRADLARAGKEIARRWTPSACADIVFSHMSLIADPKMATAK